MDKKRKKYTREFKLDAVRLVIEEGRQVKDVAESLGINQGILQRWKKELLEDGSVAFPGHGKLKPVDEEVRELRRQLARVQQERDILKKALGYFADPKQ